MAGSLDGLGHFALVFRGSAGDAAGQDLTLLVDKLQQEVGIFVVDVLDAVLLEAAIFLSLGIDRDGSQILDVVVVLCHFSKVLIVLH